MNTERFSESIGAIKDAVAKLEFLLATEQKRSELPRVPLKTEEAVLTAINERVACQCVTGLWDQVKDSMRAQHQRDERRVWRQIVAAIRANDEAEASRLAKAAGIPTECLKS
jgi:DNA-binding FadR family transcriptional regulator